jgi:hypothetical protein
VRAHEDPSGYVGNWSVTAYAICGVVEGELILRSHAGPQNSTNKGVTLDCHDGFQLFGMGVDMLSTVEGAGAGFGHTNDRLVIDEITPSGDLFSAPREVTIWVLEESPSPEIWWQDVYGICFDPA